jgi:hypothetical protein
MSKTDDQLRSEIEANETRGEWGAWAVVAGLVLEIILASAISLGIEKKEIENWGAVIADCLIALGVYCEIHFGRRASHGHAELRRRSELRIAEANVRAAEANRKAAEAELALAKFREPRQSYVKGNESLIAERLGPFAGTQFDSGLTGGSGEVADFWWDLQPTIVAAGWVHLPFVVPNTLIIRQGDRPLSASVGATNVEIHVRPEERSALGPAAVALISVLNEIGIEATDKGFNSHSPNSETIHIHIGDKR